MMFAWDDCGVCVWVGPDYFLVVMNWRVSLLLGFVGDFLACMLLVVI